MNHVDRIMNECLGGAHPHKWDVSDSVNKDSKTEFMNNNNKTFIVSGGI